MEQTLLSIEHLKKSYDDNLILDDINLEVHQGEVIVLVGPSGCGKSTMLRCINALEPIQGGEIKLSGEKIDPKNKNIAELRQKANYTFVTFDSSCGLSEMIGKMRIIKTPEEIEKIVKAQRIAERAFSRLLRDIKPGQTEKHVAALLEYYMAEYGSDGKSFDTIAASGVNSASPHAVPTDKKLENGDFLTLDFGATYDGYHSDMTRTIAIGKVTDDMKKMYDAVLFANLDAMKAIRADISGKVADSVARSTLDAWGFGKYFGHGLGHGVGLEIHEAPSNSRTVAAAAPGAAGFARLRAGNHLLGTGNTGADFHPQNRRSSGTAQRPPAIIAGLPRCRD